MVATRGIFAPTFLLVGITGAVVAKIRKWVMLRSMMDGGVVGSLARMGEVAWRPGRAPGEEFLS